LLLVEGQPLALRLVDRLRTISDDVLLVGDRLERFQGSGARLIPDEVTGFGVLGGMLTSLRQARHPHVFVTACDMPFLDPALVRFLAELADGYDVVMPQLGGILQPTHAVYAQSALPAIERLVASGDRCPLNFLPDVRLRTVSEDEIATIDPQLRSFFNVNKRRDWDQMQGILDPSRSVSRDPSPSTAEKPISVPVVSIVGKSNVGKTTLIEKLVPELQRRGYRVATIKHDVHPFELDLPGKDTWRHAQAGSDCVVISSAEKLAIIQKTAGELTLDQIVAQLPPVDVVLTEGYKRQDKPKIEVSRREMGPQLLCTRDQLLCLATDQPFDLDVPQFDLDDAPGIVDLIESRYLRR
jgi:molybdopterin-guanine dinucleotide biosynthesis protein